MWRGLKLFHWRLQLKWGDWSQQARAAEELGGLHDLRAVRALVRALHYGDRFPVRQQAAKALGLIGDATAVEALMVALEDSEPHVCQEAIKALVEIRDPRPVELLISLIKSHNADVRACATGAVVNFGSMTVPFLMQILRLSHFEARQAAAEALGLIGDARALAPLLAALKDPDSAVRREAIEAIAHIGQAAEEPVLHLLDDPDSEVRAAAAKTLGKLRDRRAIERLRSATNDPEMAVRDAAWHALALLDWEPAHTREKTLRALNAGDYPKAVSLGAAAVEPMIESFRAADKSTRQKISEALILIGRDAIDSLIARLKDPDPNVRVLAAQILAALGWQPAEPEQEALLSVATGHYEKAVALGGVALDVLAEKLQSHDEWDRIMAAKSLGQLGVAAALESLVTALNDPSYKVREAATNALGEIGNEVAIAALKDALGDSHYNVRAAASICLRRHGVR